jgi:hypothetical protein
MSSVASLLSIVHLVVLSVFVGGTSVLMLGAILSRLRVRRPLLCWRSGSLICAPLGPTLFLVVVFGVLGWMEVTGRSIPLSVWIGYPAGGLFWFVATWLVQSVVVTEYGLVPDLLHLRRAVAWSQIVDYVETRRDGQRHFVFFYRDRDTRERRRLDVPVPDWCANDLQEIVEAKLATRFTTAPGEAVEKLVDRPDDPLDQT